MPAMKNDGCLNLDGSSPGDIFEKLLQELDPANPIEFQLPHWLKRKKPLNYTSIRRNVYLTKRIKKRTEDDGIFCFCSPLSGSSSVCGRDCQCGMLLSSCSASCKCGISCLNKSFQNRPIKKMKLVKTEKCGYGLLADEDIKQGEFVIEYVGEVIDDKTCEERLWDMKHRGETNFYLCEINRDMVIDATYKGNKSRYINHSCQPNTEMQKWRIDGETRIGIFSTRDIKKGLFNLEQTKIVIVVLWAVGESLVVNLASQRISRLKDWIMGYHTIFLVKDCRVLITVLVK
ncbi:histone-lysine N-methyltransferase ASHH3 isoform X3 [Aristolochia californica]|uniref:histone-lysine N-methyltransferase ASHH3 isoform X3 n=1 Tax=Aristolochia californica TaxID=171875 RepID=UPI0035E36C38